MARLDAKAAEAELIAFAAGMPEAWEDHPWDHTVLKVGKKVFVFFGGAAAAPNILSVTVKLPISYEMALTLPFMRPAGHGLRDEQSILVQPGDLGFGGREAEALVEELASSQVELSNLCNFGSPDSKRNETTPIFGWQAGGRQVEDRQAIGLSLPGIECIDVEHHTPRAPNPFGATRSGQPVATISSSNFAP